MEMKSANVNLGKEVSMGHSPAFWARDESETALSLYQRHQNRQVKTELQEDLLFTQRQDWPMTVKKW